MKVPVEFPVDFTKNEVCPLQLGRFNVGVSYVARLVFDKDGRLKLLIPQEAIDDGSVLIAERMSTVAFCSFGKTDEVA